MTQPTHTEAPAAAAPAAPAPAHPATPAAPAPATPAKSSSPGVIASITSLSIWTWLGKLFSWLATAVKWIFTKVPILSHITSALHISVTNLEVAAVALVLIVGADRLGHYREAEAWRPANAKLETANADLAKQLKEKSVVPVCIQSAPAQIAPVPAAEPQPAASPVPAKAKPHPKRKLLGGFFG